MTTQERFREACRWLAERDKRFSLVNAYASDFASNEFLEWRKEPNEPAKGKAIWTLTQDDLDELAAMLGWEYWIVPVWNIRNDEEGQWTGRWVYVIHPIRKGESWRQHADAEEYSTKLTAALESVIAIIYRVYPKEEK